jgi:aspartate racemase
VPGNWASVSCGADAKLGRGGGHREQKKSTGRPVVGVLGGMGPAATADFYRRLVAATPAVCDQEHLHVLIDSQPDVPDRSDFLLGRGEDPAPALREMAQRLEQAGATMLVIACNSASPFTARVAEAVTIPVIDWVHEVTESVLERAPALTTFGLLATDGTVSTGIYQRCFEARDRRILLPNPNYQRRVMDVIRSVKAGRANDLDHRAVADSIAELGAAGAQAVLLVCTELSLLLATKQYPTALPAFDAAQLVAERIAACTLGPARREREVHPS